MCFYQIIRVCTSKYTDKSHTWKYESPGLHFNKSHFFFFNGYILVLNICNVFSLAVDINILFLLCL